MIYLYCRAPNGKLISKVVIELPIGVVVSRSTGEIRIKKASFADRGREEYIPPGGCVHFELPNEEPSGKERATP